MELAAEFLYPYDTDMADQAFMTGVFSLAEAMFGSTGLDVIQELRIIPSIDAAIRAHGGKLGALLRCAEAVEMGDEQSIEDACAALPGLEQEDAGRISLEALRWISQYSSHV